jgi:predicted transcriptional regulator
MKPTLTKEKVTLEAIGQLIEKSVAKLATKEEMKTAISDAVDGLAIAVKKGFEEVHTKFAKIDERFEKIDERFEQLEFKIDRMDTRLTNQLDQVYLNYPSRSDYVLLDTRVKKVEGKVGI